MVIPYWLVLLTLSMMTLVSAGVTFRVYLSRRALLKTLKRLQMPTPKILGVQLLRYGHVECPACSGILGSRVDHGDKRVCPKCGAFVAKTLDMVAAFLGERRPTSGEIQQWVLRRDDTFEEGLATLKEEDDHREKMQELTADTEQHIKDMLGAADKTLSKIEDKLYERLRRNLGMDVSDLQTTVRGVRERVGINESALSNLRDRLNQLDRAIEEAGESNIWRARRINLESDDDIPS